MSPLLSSTPSSLLLLLRQNPNPNPNPLRPKPSPRRRSLATCASLLSPPPPPPPSPPPCLSTSSLFFARIPRGSLSTAMYAVGSTMVKWLDIYSGILLLRVLLSWFPDLPWHKQPMSTLRDMCDPYLGLFRRIIPPIFGSLDLSPIVAFAVLGFVNKALVGAVYSLV